MKKINNGSVARRILCLITGILIAVSALTTAYAADKIGALTGLPEAPVAVRGESPVRPYYTPRDRNGNPVNILKVKPLTDPEKCDQCGLCAALCPMGSIDPADAAHIPGICIKCCACVKACANKARKYDTPFASLLSECFKKQKLPQTIL